MGTRDLTRSRPAPLPALGAGGTVRYWWNQLTSMRTALVLLFLLAVAAIPGSIVPQRGVSPVAVLDFIDANPELGAFYDRIGMFDVYTSAWFSAIYLLLFVSLIGCIVPRIATYARQLRAVPVRTPARLTRLPVHAVVARAAGETDARLIERAGRHLQRRRYRVAVDDTSVSAERGYLREAGNLVFHLSLVLLLIGLATGSLWGYRGNAIVVVGQSFSNTITQYDDIVTGPRFAADQLAPFSVRVDDFRARFELGPVQNGAAREFRADVTVTDRPGAAPRTGTIEVNRPLEVGGTQVHLVAHGYAPLVTVLDEQGNTAFSGPVPFLPQDGNFTSVGAIKAVDARPERLAFQGFFLPTAVVDEQGPRSIFPDAIRPQLFLNGWYGPPREETGEPENVYSLNTTGLTQMRAGEDAFRMQLSPGDQVALPEGRGQIRFDGWTRWVKLQVSYTPALWLTAGSIVLAVSGLCLSLFVRPRRLWVRVFDDRIEVAGLDRADARTGLGEEVDDLALAVIDDPGDDLDEDADEDLDEDAEITSPPVGRSAGVRQDGAGATAVRGRDAEEAN